LSTKITPSPKYRLGITRNDITYIVGKSRYNLQQLRSIFRSELQITLKTIILEIAEWINYKVPKRTGALRQNLLLNLRASAVVDTQMKLILGTSINYADRVNDMPTAWVRHYNTTREHSGAKAYGPSGIPITLDDPQAIGHFWDKLLDYAKERVQINLSKMKYRIENNTGLNSRQLTRLKVM